MSAMATSVSASDGEDSHQSWDLTNPICLATISKRKSAFLPYKPNTASPPVVVASSLLISSAGSAASTSTSPAAATNAASTGLNSCVLTNLQRGNTEAHIGGADIALSFHERCGQGEVTDAEVQRERHATGKLNAVDAEYEFTPLHWAAHYGQLHTVQLLCRHGAEVNRLAPEHVSPLLLAAAGGHHEVVKCLLQNGADAHRTDIAGNTALMYAAAGNHPHTTNELLAGHLINITATNEHGDSAYGLAVQNGATLSQAVLENYIVSMLTV